MRERRLLERFTQADEPVFERSSGPDKAILLASVSSHLQRILNTRRGSVLADPDYGIPDFSTLPGGFSTPETEEVIQSIVRAVERYEPRLSDVRVRFGGVQEGDAAMRFELDGMIRTGDREIPLRLSTQMGADSSFTLSAGAEPQ